MARQPILGQGLFTVEASRSYSDTLPSMEVVWTSDQPDAETSYLTKHNTHEGHTFMPPVRFEPATPASQRPQNHGLDGAASGIGCL